MVFKSLMGATCTCLVVASFSADAALISRLGGLAYYDDVADLTWLTNASAAAGSMYDVTNPGTGQMKFSEATAWVTSLEVAGVTGWRLPETIPIDGTTSDDATISYNGTEDSGFNISAPGTLYAGSFASELAYMFYNTLGNKSGCDPILSTTSTCVSQVDWGLTNTGPFTNLRGSTYYGTSTTGYVGGTIWAFTMFNGSQTIQSTDSFITPWAVYSGDVSAVPVPAAVWLFGSGLIGLLGVARRKKA